MFAQWVIKNKLEVFFINNYIKQYLIEWQQHLYWLEYWRLHRTVCKYRLFATMLSVYFMQENQEQSKEVYCEDETGNMKWGEEYFKYGVKFYFILRSYVSLKYT